MGGQIQPRRASFAKGKYYVEIAASPDGDHTAALQAFIAKMEPLLAWSAALRPKRWTGSQRKINTSVRLVPESVLGLKQLKRGYVAKYEQGQAFIVLEASPGSAAEVFKKVQARFPDATPAKIADEAFQAKTQYLDGICIFRKGRYVAGYANLPDSQQAVSLATKLAARLP